MFNSSSEAYTLAAGGLTFVQPVQHVQPVQPFWLFSCQKDSPFQKVIFIIRRYEGTFEVRYEGTFECTLYNNKVRVSKIEVLSTKKAL